MVRRRAFTAEFKQETALLIIDQHYSYKEACEAMGVGETALRRWVKQVRSEQDGITPIGSKAITLEQQTIQTLQQRIRKLEREKEILKKATALLMSDNYQENN